MKQYIKFSYTEEYLPTPRCKKLREREVKSSTSINIKECSKEDAPLVMVVKSYDCEECEIRVFKGKLYRNVQWRNMNRADGDPIEQNETINTINWQFIIWGNDYYNDSRWTGERGDATSKANIKKRASKYLIIGDMVFMRTTEPIYNITCFGCNDSAGMFVDYADKDSTYCYNYLRISLRWYRCSGRMVPRGAEPWYRSYRSDGTGTKCPLYTLSKGALQIVLQGTLS